MLPDGEPIVDLRHAGDAGEPVEHLVFVAQPGGRVEVRPVQPGVRESLLEDHAKAVGLAVREADPAAVGKMQGTYHPIGELRDLSALTRRDAVRQTRRYTHPARH